MEKKSQAGTEYLIVVGFVTFAIVSILAFSLFYSNKINDEIRFNQAESFAVNLINSAESVFFAGEPSKSTKYLYLPEGVEEITISNYTLIMKILSSSGDNVRAFSSDVPMNGTINPGQGSRKIILEAKTNFVQISEG